MPAKSITRSSATTLPGDRSVTASKATRLPGISWNTADAIRGLVLMLVTAALWITVQDRWNRVAWNLPLSYSTDAKIELAFIQAAEEGDYNVIGTSKVRRLGAPFDANWNDYPMYEKTVIWLTGVLARWCGLMAASNVLVMGACALSGLSFYFCCRILRYRWEYSWAGALLFAFTYYQSYRSLPHVFIALSYTVPLALLASWLIYSSRRLGWKHSRSWLCLAIAFLMGISNPYNLGVYLQLLVLGLLAHCVTRRRRENVLVGLASLGLAAAGFLLVNSGTLYTRWKMGPNDEALVRSYTDTERYGLKPIELVVPPSSHRVARLAGIGTTYRLGALVTGEMFSPYLGGIALAGLIWLFAEAFVRSVRRGNRAMPAAALQCSWIMAFSVIGGLNSLLGLGGFALLRASNRNSIFISCLALLFLVSRVSRVTRTWKWPVRWLATGVCVTVGLLDQIPKSPPATERENIMRIVDSDRDFFRNLEDTLPPRAMVFQLPVMGFPESASVNNLEAYQNCRGYLFTKSLRFSYGSNKGRVREEWQDTVEDLEVPNLIRKLESYGFAAVLFSRKGYTDSGKGLIQQLGAIGYTNMREDSVHEQVCVPIHPSSNPALPDTTGDWGIEHQYGWSGVEYGNYGPTREGMGKAMVCVSNHRNQPANVILNFSVNGQHCGFSLTSAKWKTSNFEISPSSNTVFRIMYTLDPGKNYFLFEARSLQDTNLYSTFLVSRLGFEEPAGSLPVASH